MVVLIYVVLLSEDVSQKVKTLFYFYDRDASSSELYVLILG